MNKKIIIGIVAIIIVVVAVVLITAKSPTPANTNAPELEPQSAASEPAPTNPQAMTPSSAPAQKVAMINIQNFQFNSSSLTVKIGTTVVWNNNDGTSHTVTSDQRSELASPKISQGGTYQHTFNSVGTFTYHCSIHPSMKGTVVVTN